MILSAALLITQAGARYTQFLAILPFFYIGTCLDGVGEKPKIILLAKWG